MVQMASALQCSCSFVFEQQRVEREAKVLRIAAWEPRSLTEGAFFEVDIQSAGGGDKMTIALERLKAVSLAYRKLGPGPVVSTDKVVDLILRDPSFRPAFEYERQGTTEVLSRSAIKEWLRTAQYWGIVAEDLLALSAEGAKIVEGAFANLLQRQLARAVQEQWDLDLTLVEARLRELRVASQQDRPDIRNWHRIVAEVSKKSVSRYRFGQLVGFLLGLGIIRREICHLYFTTG